MRLAFVTSLLPTGASSTGFEIANAAVVAGLRDAGCKVTLFGFLRDGEAHTPPVDSVILDRITLENAEASRSQKMRWLVGAFQTGLPVISTKLVLADRGRMRASLAAHGPFDGIVINSAPVAGAFPWLFDQGPCLLVAHNVEHRSAMENSATAAGLVKALYRREARLLEDIENTAVTRSRFIWCFSDADRQGFGVDIQQKSALLPLLLPDLPRMEPVEPAHDIGLIGTWTWQPNMVGLRWFLDEVVPHLPPDLTVAVAGRLPPGFQSSAPVSFLGRVEDASHFVAASRVIALASRSGTGVQLKSIETFQTGKPCVATRSSIRGFDYLPSNCLVADDAERYAAALAKLAQNVRAERAGSVDPTPFVSRQELGLANAIRMGLKALKA